MINKINIRIIYMSFILYLPTFCLVLVNRQSVSNIVSVFCQMRQTQERSRKTRSQCGVIGNRPGVIRMRDWNQTSGGLGVQSLPTPAVMKGRILFIHAPLCQQHYWRSLKPKALLWSLLTILREKQILKQATPAMLCQVKSNQATKKLGKTPRKCSYYGCNM